MCRSILILITVLVYVCCTQQKQPEVEICVNEEKLSYKLLDTANFKCVSHKRHLFDWGRYEIAENDLMYFRGGLRMILLYSKTMNKLFYYQSYNIFNNEIVFFDSTYYFKKGTSIFLNTWMSESSETLHIKTLEYFLGTIYKLQSIEFALAEWHSSIKPYLMNSMRKKGLTDNFISQAEETMGQEITKSITGAKDIFISQIGHSYTDPTKEDYIRIFVISKSSGKNNPFEYYEFEI